MDLTNDQIERYSRQIILEEVGLHGQEKISNGRVLIVGAGGLGAPAAYYLAAAGVGIIGLVDFDQVELNNLQRQIIHSTADVGRPKVDSAADKMQALNPDVEVRTYNEPLRAGNALDLIREYDFVIDGTDNFGAKFLINDACVLAGTPYSHAGILRFDGQTMTVRPGESACYRCVFPQMPPEGAIPTCSQAGVLGVLAGTFGVLQATEALKALLGIGDMLTDRLLSYNAKTMDFRKRTVRRDLSCPVCGEHPTITGLTDGDQPQCDLKGGGACDSPVTP